MMRVGRKQRVQRTERQGVGTQRCRLPGKRDDASHIANAEVIMAAQAVDLRHKPPDALVLEQYRQ